MAGKKFAAEFALRRNVSAQDKILIQDSDDDVVKYAYPPQIASLSGYAYAQSVADLPLLPTNKSIGYIVGQMLYIYVGMGGDTKDGLYQSVGFFVGPQGVQGEKGEKGERGEQGVQGPKGDNGGLSLQELDKYLATKQYVTGDTLADMLAGYVSNTSLMRDYVTIAKTQDVTGVKNFTAGVQFGGLPMYKSKDDTVFLDGNLVVRGAVTMYGMNTTTSPSIFSVLPIDGVTIGRNEKGELCVIGGTGGGGVADSVAWSNVTNKPTWITDTKPKYSYSEILGTPDLSVYATTSSMSEALKGKADKATTLAGYGITNAYTKSEINNIIDSLDDTYVTIAGEEQSITAEHNFVNGFKVGGLPIKKSKDKTLYLDANLVVSGAITMYGSDSTTFPTIWASIPFDSTMEWDGSKWSVVGGGSGEGGGITSSMVTNALGYTPYNSSNPAGYITSSGSITGNAATATSSQYLYQSNIQESINYPRGADHAIKVVNCTTTQLDGFFAEYSTVLSVASPLSNFQIGMYANPFATWASHPRFRAMRNTDGTWTDWKELAFVDDLNAYLPLAGGTVNGNIKATSFIGNASSADRLVEEVVTDLNNATAGRIFTMTSGYGSTAGNKPTEYWVTGLTLAYAHNSSFRRQLAFADAIDESLYLRAEHIGVWGEWSKILTSSNFYDYALPITGGTISGDLEIGGSVYSSVGNLRIKARNSTMAGVEIAVSDNDFWQISHRGSFYNNELNFYHNANGTWSNSVLSLTGNGDVATGGNLLINGALTMNYSSDERLKQNIRKVNASKMLMSLGGVYQYEYIGSEVAKNSTYEGSHYGLIYQNVKGTALKSMCHEREDGFGTLNYLDTNFISLVAGATMENISEVEKLKKENKALRKRVEQLEKRIA